MADFAICEMHPRFIRQMARDLRRDHANMVLALGKNIYEALEVFNGQSFFSRAWLVNGELGAIGGVTGSLLAPEGYVWLAFTEHGLQFPCAIVREACKQLQEIMHFKTKLTAFILPDDLAAQRFVEFLGFEFIDFTADNFLMYVLQRQAVCS